MRVLKLTNISSLVEFVYVSHKNPKQFWGWRQGCKFSGRESKLGIANLNDYLELLNKIAPNSLVTPSPLITTLF